MPMDEMVTPKPELYGLRPTWSGAFMGMMTMIRVLPPELYDKIMDLKKQEPQDKKAGEKNRCNSSNTKRSGAEIRTQS